MKLLFRILSQAYKSNKTDGSSIRVKFLININLLLIR